MMKNADDYVADRKAEGEKIIEDALAEKARIEAEAKKAADDIHAQMVIQTELDKEVLARTKREAEDFRTRIIVEYRNHMEMIKKIPEDCFNEFVVIETIVPGIRRTVGMNDDLRVRTFGTHSVTSGFKQV